MSAIEMIAAERLEQLEKHGVSIADDAHHNDKGQLMSAARKLSIADKLEDIILRNPPHNWGRATWIRMCKKPYKDRLVIAAALIAAEIDRLNYESD